MVISYTSLTLYCTCWVISSCLVLLTWGNSQAQLI